MADFNIHLDDLTSFYESVVKPGKIGPLWVMGHSMGGHLILRWLAERQKAGIQGAILTAPMLALGPRLAHGAGLGISRAAVELGFGEHYGPGQHNYGERDKAFIDNPLSHDPLRFGLMECYFEAHPQLKIGGVTYGWLYAALKSMKDERSPSYFKDLALPILTMTGDQDRVTPVKENMRYLSQLPHGETIVIPNALHDIMGESENFRVEAWKNIDRFLARA
jgi:lysophospholipase